MKYQMGKCLTVAIGITWCVGGLMLPWVPDDAIGFDNALVPNDSRVLNKFWDGENIP